MSKSIVHDDIAKLRKQLEELEVKAGVRPAPVEKPLQYSQVQLNRYVCNYNEGTPDLTSRVPCWNLKLAVETAETMAKKSGRVVRFIPWDKSIDDVMIGPDVAGLSWQEKIKSQKGVRAVLIIEELFASWPGHSFEKITTWKFDKPLPKTMGITESEVAK